jgi:putative aldouronate transport system substrate-binding protein
MQTKKRFTLLAAALLSTSLLATACGSSTDSSSAPSSGASGAPAANPSSGAVTPIEVMMTGWGSTLPSKDFVKPELDKALNTNLTLTITNSSDDFIQKLNLRAAGADLPDIIKFPGKTEYLEYAKRGLLLDLTPYKDKLGDVKNLVGDQVFSRAEIGGKPYAITTTPNIYYGVPWVRKDWLDKLGLQVPKTLDELLEVSKAFTSRDPDGNGKNDTFGITSELTVLASLVMPLHGVTDGFYIKNGQMVHGIYQQEMKDAVAYMKKMIDTGTIDPEIASNKLANYKDKAFQGKAGIVVMDWTNIVKDDARKVWKEANPNADWVMLSELKGPNADTLGTREKGATGGYMAISKSAEKDKAKLDKIFELFNYVSKGDGLNLVQFGLKDVHFKVENGKTVLTDKAPEAAFTWLYQLAGRPEAAYLSTKFPAQEPYIQANEKVKVIETYNSYVTLPPDFNAADATRFRQEELLKFYYGKNKLEAYDDFLKKLDTTFRFKSFVDNGLKELKELGLAK